MNTDRIETGFGFETSGVDRGVDRIEKAFDRMEKAEQKAIKAQQAREIDAARKSLDAGRQALKEREKLEKEASETRIRITQDEYKRLDQMERTRLATMRQQMQQSQIRAGISANGNAAGRVASGGHGGNGGGLLGGQARLIGDVLDNVTGTPGWVMKMRGLEGIAGHLGRAAMPFAPAALLGFEAFRTAKAANGEMSENAKASDRLDTETSAIGRSSAFANAGQGTSSLGEQLAHVREQQKAELEQSAKLDETRRKMSGDFNGAGDRFNPIAMMKGTIFSNIDQLRHLSAFGGAPTNEEQRRISEQRSRELAGAGQQISAQRTAAFAHERATAAERLNGSAFEAQRMDADMAEKRETADAKKLEASEQDLALIRQKYDLERERIDREEQAAGVEGNLQDRLLTARKMGLNEVASAEIQLQEARYAKEAAIGQLAQRAADRRIEEAQLALATAEREHDFRRKNLQEDSTIANFRGNGEQRAVLSADSAQNRALERYNRLKADFEAGGKGVKQEDLQAAKNQLDSANTARVMLEREQSAARARGRSADSQANIRFGAEVSGTGAGAVDQRRTMLQAEVDIAKEQRRLAAEIAEKEQNSLSSVEALHRAQEGVANALLKQKQYEIELARTRRIELANAQTETAAMRLQNAGRGDSASMLRSRHESENAQYEALRNSNPQLAGELAQQQKTRETGAFLEKFYNADGTKRDRGQINRDEQKARLTAGRRGRASDRFERDLGLINVQRGFGGQVVGGTDPFTHQHVSAAEVRARLNRPADRAAADKAGGAKSLADLWTLLDTRLPSK